ncbi:MAG: spermidine/putrescine ABC transporter ATP-binding protein PotA [Thermodesulfobacteriota bacterium]
MSRAVVQLQHVTKAYEGLAAIDDLSLEVFAGEFLTLLGPSGCGKTTILRLIAGFEAPDRGDIRIDDVRVNALPPNRRDVNTVFQSYALFPHMNVFDNVAFGLKLKGLKRDAVADRVRAVLEMVQLGGMESRRVTQLSGGQQQRVAFARAVVNEPLVLLLDEPLSALDYRLRKEMQLELKRLHRKLGITFIFVTHDQEEAITMSDRIIVMNQGRVAQAGSPKQIYEEPANLFVARFVGEINTFDGTVEAAGADWLTARIHETDFRLVNKRGFRSGDPVKVLLRPEDLQIHKTEPADGKPSLVGAVEELIYKGSTVDVIIRLTDGKPVYVTEFFNENAAYIFYERGQKVWLRWIDRWEVVLPDA